MAGVAGSIIFELLMKTGSFETDVARAERALKKLESEAKKASNSNKTLEFNVKTNSIDNAVGSFGKFSTAIKGLAALQGVQTFSQLSDEGTKLDGILKNITNTNFEYSKSIDDVNRIASISQTGLTNLGIVYARIGNSVAEFGGTQLETAKITETLSLALKVNGATSAETSSALIQLSQAFGKGKLDGDEFRTAMEAAPVVMKRLAESMGVPFGALKDLAAQGLITTEVLIKAYSDDQYIAGLRKQAEGMQTISGGFVEIRNEAVNLISAFNDTVPVDKFIGKLQDGVVVLLRLLQFKNPSDFALPDFETSSSTGKIRELNERLVEAQVKADQLSKSPFANQDALDKASLTVATIQRQIDYLKGTKVSVNIDIPLLAKDNALPTLKSNELKRNEAELARLKNEYRAEKLTGGVSEREVKLKFQITAQEGLIKASKEQAVRIDAGLKSLTDSATLAKAEKSAKAFIGDEKNLTSKGRVEKDIKALKQAFSDQTKGLSESSAVYKEAKTVFDKKLDELEEKGNKKGNKKEKKVKGGKSQAEQDAEDAKRFVESLEKQALSLGLSESEAIRYEASLVKLSGSQKIVTESLIAEIEARTRLNALIEEGTQTTLGLLNPQERYNNEIERLQKLLENKVITPEIFDRGMAKAIEDFSSASDEYKKVRDEQTKLNDVLKQTPTYKLEEMREEMLRLGKAFEDGLPAEEFLEAVDVVLGRTNEKVEKTTDLFEELFEKAAKNAQSALADFLFDPFSEGLDGMLLGFVNVIKRMSAEALAAQIFKKLLGDDKEKGTLDEVFANIQEKLGNAFTSIFDTLGVSTEEGSFLGTIASLFKSDTKENGQPETGTRYNPLYIRDLTAEEAALSQTVQSASSFDFSSIIGGGASLFSGMGFFANGGPINGPGTGTSDQVPIMASNGEYIMTAEKTRQFYPILESMRKGTFGKRKFASGGIVDSGGLQYNIPGGDTSREYLNTLQSTARLQNQAALAQSRNSAEFSQSIKMFSPLASMIAGPFAGLATSLGSRYFASESADYLKNAEGEQSVVNSIDRYFNEQYNTGGNTTVPGSVSTLSDSDITGSTDELNSSLGDLQYNMESTASSADQMGTQTESVFGNLFSSVKDFASGVFNSFSDIFSGLGSSISGLLSNLTGSGGGGSFFGSILGFFGGGKASGGSIEGNRPFLVGERGPEIFVPRSAGNIVPNAQLQQPSSAPVTLKNINVFDKSIVGDFLNTDEGEKVMLNFMQRNRGVYS